MGNAFLHGNGGGVGKLFGVIAVTFPEGSTITCTNGAKTLKAKTTSGKVLFAVPSAGTWTVTATDGTETKSETVQITYEGQSVSVVLSYITYILKDGVVQSPASGFDASMGNGTHTPSISFGTDGQMTVTIAGWSEGNANGFIHSKEATDVTNCTKMTVRLKLANAISTDVNTWVGVVKTAGATSANAYKNLEHNTSEQTITVDLSSLSGSVYFVCKIYGHDTHTGNTYAFYDISFE